MSACLPAGKPAATFRSLRQDHRCIVAPTAPRPPRSRTRGFTTADWARARHLVQDRLAQVEAREASRTGPPGADRHDFRGRVQAEDAQVVLKAVGELWRCIRRTGLLVPLPVRSGRSARVGGARRVICGNGLAPLQGAFLLSVRSRRSASGHLRAASADAGWRLFKARFFYP
jgi:hypothetical protein